MSGETPTDAAGLAELFSGFEVVDLSHTLEAGMPVWPTHARFGHILYESQELGDIATQYGLVLGEHTGTHMDAPLHFIAEGPAHYGADAIPLDRLAGRAAVIEAPELPSSGVLGAEHISRWEDENGPIREQDRVLIRYGWDRRWGVGADGTSFLQDWPGLSGEAAEYLVERGVLLVGCDTLAVDAFGSEENPAHYALLGNEVLVVENLKNLDALPPFCFFMAFPLKVKGGSGSPVRALALVPRET